MTDTEDLLKRCWDQARQALEANGELDFHSVLIDTEKPAAAVLVQPPNVTKDDYAYLLDQAVKHLDANLVLVVSEAWAVTRPRATAFADAPVPSEAPDRMEIVMIAWKSASGEQGCQTAPIHRDEAGKPSINSKEIEKLSMPSNVSFNRYLDGLFITGMKH